MDFFGVLYYPHCTKITNFCFEFTSLFIEVEMETRILEWKCYVYACHTYNNCQEVHHKDNNCYSQRKNYERHVFMKKMVQLHCTVVPDFTSLYFKTTLYQWQ